MIQRMLTRRAMLSGSLALVGSAATATLLRSEARAEPHHTPRAKRVVYLFMCGAPSQLETFDHKPGLMALGGTELPDSIRMGERLTGMSAGQGSFPVVPSRFAAAQHGESGAWVSELLPHTAAIVDRLCIVRSMQTDALNHDPAMTLMHTGSQLVGRPSLGSWIQYGLGSPDSDLPAFTVLVSSSRTERPPQPVGNHFWSSGFLPARHQGVMLRSGPDPVLYLDDGTGATPDSRARLRDARAHLDAIHLERTGDPEIAARIASYDLAFRMQTAVPDLASIADEPASTYTLYGDEARVPGTFSHHCLMARRLLERGGSYVQLYHRDWDHHGTIQTDHPRVARDTDRASAALVLDLERRGLLDDTLVIWGGEFGRTVYAQGPVTTTQYGRDHHRRCFSMWMAGGGVKPGIVHGTTDDYSYNVVEDPMHVHDLHATALDLLGFDHTRLTYRHGGRDVRLTDVAGRVVREILR